ncbi:MAG: hypothetical protein ACJ76B_01180 [Solirubrobacterales bacterium]
MSDDKFNGTAVILASTSAWQFEQRSTHLLASASTAGLLHQDPLQRSPPLGNSFHTALTAPKPAISSRGESRPDPLADRFEGHSLG